MKSFGQALRALRGDRTGVEVAEKALGQKSTRTQQRDFGNYLSRIERDKVPSVGLDRLRLIAKGLGLEPLSVFFLHLEHAQSRDLIGDKKTVIVRLQTDNKQEQNVSPPRSVGEPDALAASLRDPPNDALDRIRFALREAGTLLFAAGVQDVAGIGESDSTTDLGTPAEVAEHDRLHTASTRKRQQG